MTNKIFEFQLKLLKLLKASNDVTDTDSVEFAWFNLMMLVFIFYSNLLLSLFDHFDLQTN